MLKIMLTAKLKLTLTSEQKAALDQTALAYRNALNFASGVAFEQGMITNQAKLHKLVYSDVRERFKLPSQMACSVTREVAAKYKHFWTTLKKYQIQKAAGRSLSCGRDPEPLQLKTAPQGRRYKSMDKAPKFISRTLTYVYGRDMTFKPDQHVSIKTLTGRIVAPYEGYSKHLKWLKDGTKVGESKLYYQKSKKQYYLLVSMEVESKQNQYTQAVGVDVGQRYHLTASSDSCQAMFVSGKQARQRKDHYSRRRRELQQKGTRSAKQRLIALSGRERRFIADTNHKTSYQVLQRFPTSMIGVEDLTNIRQRTERRSSAKASPKRKRANRRMSQWSFAELHSFLAYKAPLYGSELVKVDAEYTSQQCPTCGHTSKANRKSAGLLFECKECNYRLHADLIGARNVCMRTLSVWQDQADTGRLSFVPVPIGDNNMSDVDTKTERLQKYSGLRWSPDTSPDCTLEGINTVRSAVGY